MKKLKIFLLLACIYSQIFKAASAADAAAAASEDEIVQTIKDAPGSFTQHLQPFKDNPCTYKIITPFPYCQITTNQRKETVFVAENRYAIIGKKSPYKKALIGPCSPCTAIIIRNTTKQQTLIIHKRFSDTNKIFTDAIVFFLKDTADDSSIIILTKELDAEETKMTGLTNKAQAKEIKDLAKLIQKNHLHSTVNHHIIKEAQENVWYPSALKTFLVTKDDIFSTCLIQEHIFKTAKIENFKTQDAITALALKIKKKKTPLESPTNKLAPVTPEALLSNLNPEAPKD